MRRQGLLSAALQTAGAFFVEPAEAVPRREPVAGSGSCATVAVFGLGPGCGASVVARGLAVELGRRDPAGAAVVLSEARATGVALATQAAARLARACEEVPGASARAIGRVALVQGAEAGALADGTRGLAPLVFDAGSTTLGGAPAALAESSVIVTSPAIEPALAPVAAECVARVGREPLIVLNRARERGDPATDPAATSRQAPPPGAVVLLPESRLGARLALTGREARGELGRAIAALADLVERS